MEKLSAMKEFSKMEFKTVNKFSRGQISAVALFVVMSFILMFLAVFNEGQGNQVPARVIVFAGALFGLYILYKTAQGWFINVYHLEIDGKNLYGKNLFGKEFRINLDDVQEFRKVKGLNSLELVGQKTGKFEVAPAIDYNGYINDYIVTNISKNARIDMGSVNKFRSMMKYWKYTRSEPFNTKYEEGYLDWLEPIVEAQKKELIAKGILQPNVLYGERDVVREAEKEKKRKDREFDHRLGIYDQSELKRKDS